MWKKGKSSMIYNSRSRKNSQGATLAAQLVIRYIVENPFATIQELPLKFAIFINGATPPCVLPLEGEELDDCPLEEFEEAAHLFSVFKPDEETNATKLRPAKLKSGRKVSAEQKHFSFFFLLSSSSFFFLFPPKCRHGTS